MQYVSTRDSRVKVSSARAIMQGISVESGLFVPEKLPRLTKREFDTLLKKDYCGRAAVILSKFLTDFTRAEIASCVDAAYASGKFPAGNPAPVVKLENGARMLELWHGPTCAFKDMALQLLPRLLTVSAAKEADAAKDEKETEIIILTATSGDTGKAALEGFADVPGIRILVFYPSEGVSGIQQLQMTSQEGENVAVFGVRGNFDDTQTGVKKIFTDPALAKTLAGKNKMFSSANSINWGRLAPQIAYYFSAWCDLVNEGDIEKDEKINICVPTGNFGNILAAWYAKQMGLPVGKLICASNENNVLTDFFATGTYDRRRELILTGSPSMDILISSNLERLLFEICGRDGEITAALMNELSDRGAYSIPEAAKAKLDEEFWGGFLTEEEVCETLKSTFENQCYLADTHTAVALGVYERYKRETGDGAKTIIASTANPYKFAPGILAALKGTPSDADEFAQIEALRLFSGMDIPPQIAGLKSKSPRFTETVTKAGMKNAVKKLL